MTEVAHFPVDVVNFREEARGCVSAVLHYGDCDVRDAGACLYDYRGICCYPVVGTRDSNRHSDSKTAAPPPPSASRPYE
jgi:hypothetical protein